MQCHPYDCAAALVAKQVLGVSMSDEQAMMRAAAGKLITQAFVRVVRLPEGKDPDDLSQAELEKFLPV